MKDIEIGQMELGILIDRALMMSVYSLAKSYSKDEIEILFDAMRKRIKGQGLDPENPVIGQVKESVQLIREGFSKEKK